MNEDIPLSEWDADQYLKFEAERTRPSADLLARVPLTEARRCIDIGCGPGNSTELVLGRFPEAIVTGLDNSPGMLSKARERLGGLSFEEADLTTWWPDERFDLISTGRTSMKFRVEAWRRSRDGDEQIKVTEAVFTFVAIDSGARPRPLPTG